jgi:hypothetical protein
MPADKFFQFLVPDSEGFDQGCQIFLAKNIPKREKVYQITRKCTKWPSNRKNDCKIYQVDIKFTNIFRYKTLQNLPKFGFLFLKIYHLAALVLTDAKSISGEF